MVAVVIVHAMTNAGTTEEWAIEPVGEVHQHQPHSRRLTARARGRQKQQRTAACKAAAAYGPTRLHAGQLGLQKGLSPIETGLGWRLKISTFCSKNFSPILFWGADLGGRVPFSI